MTSTRWRSGGPPDAGPGTLAGPKWATLHTGILAGLSQAEAGPYEQALADLGSLLGADAYKPAGDGRTDSAWVWPGQWWLAVEAKSEQAGQDRSPGRRPPG